MDDGNTLVADFKNGEMNGLVRLWNSQGNLTELFYKDLYTRGHAWVVSEGQLVWLPNDFLVENAQEFSVVVSMNGTEIWAGFYDSIMGLLTNVHTVDLEIVSTNQCSLDLKLKLKEKQDFILQFSFGKLHKIQQEVKCKLSGNSAEEQYKNWINDMEGPIKSGTYGLENYFKLKPSQTNFQPEKVVQPFMSQVRMIPSRDFIVEMSTWNGPLQNWTTNNPRLNSKGQLHGPNALQLVKNAYNQTGVHDFLGKYIWIFFHI